MVDVSIEIRDNVIHVLTEIEQKRIKTGALIIDVAAILIKYLEAPG